MRRVFLLHLAANAILVLLLYFWFGIRDAKASQILLTIALGAALLVSALYLHAGTWHWMRTRSWNVPQRTLLRFAAGILVFALAAWLLSLIPVARGALWTASLLTFKSRKPVNPDTVSRIFQSAIWLVKWLVLPVLLFGGAKKWRVWAVFAAVLVVSWYVPHRLVYWTPDFKSTAAEVISMLLRWSIAYVLAIAGWLFVLKEASSNVPADSSSHGAMG